MKVIKLISLFLALVYGCKANAIDTDNNFEGIDNADIDDIDLEQYSDNFEGIDSVDITDIDLDQYSNNFEGIDSADIIDTDLDQYFNSVNTDTTSFTPIKVKRSLPEKTNTTCGDGTKVCNVGFGEIKVSIYDLTWYISTPYATALETFRKKKNDNEEFVSMIGSIRNYNVFLDVYITGKVYNSGCINDTSNKCNADRYFNEPENDDNIKFYLKNIEDKTPKYIRFKYSDFFGKCYKTWKLTFDIQGTQQDLMYWHWYNKIDFDKYK